MKLSETLVKNLKLLFRSRQTAFTIVFGPLLIILLVGFAFSNGEDMRITVGTYASVYTPLADGVIQELNEKGYVVNVLSDEEACLDAVKVGTSQMCIIFPGDFEIRDNHTNEVQFHVDISRINLVYAVIDQLGDEFHLRSAAVSQDLTSRLVATLAASRTVFDEQVQNAERLQKLRQEADTYLSESDGKLSAQDLNFTFMDLRLMRGQATGLQQDAKQINDLALEQLDTAISVLNDAKKDIEENASKEKIELAIDEFEQARIEIDAIYEESPGKLAEISSMIDSAAAKIESLESDYGQVQEDVAFVGERLRKALQDIQAMRQLLLEMKGSLGYQRDRIDQLEVTEVGSIVSPITTVIRPVSAERSNLTFTYPYVLMLVIMFMGLMLGSTLIVMDKNSAAAFRNFTTSTRDEFHIFVSFLTTFLILLAQVFIILLFSYALVRGPLLNNFGTSLAIILLAITLFSFLGMIVGYLSRSQESAMITCITIGSVSLFISNLVVPIEGMNQLIRLFTTVNPYVLLSELLKKSILFGTPISEFGGRLTIVFALALALFLVTLGVQRYVRSRYFSQQAAVEVTPAMRAVRPLEILGRPVKDEYDLLTTLDLMTRQDFAAIVTDEKNPIADWVRDELGNKRLAVRIRTTSKERMILKLDKHLRRMTRKQARK